MRDATTMLASGTAIDIGAAIAAGRLTSVAATRWYLERIAQNGGPDGLNCVRSVSPLALEQAGRADAELAAGHCRGPLHGVPYLVKDNVFTSDGTFASAGSLALAQFVPPYAATLVERLCEAGAVLLGKTNMTEFADFVSNIMPAEFSGAGGVVRHPRGLRYGRGLGSSVGSAAAVAARLCAFAIGTETQNSIQAPAIHSGVVGFKPTVGRVSRHGIIPLVPSQDSPGPLTVTVADALAVYEAIAGPDGADMATLADFPYDSPRQPPLRGLRIGIPRRAMADAVAAPAAQAAFGHVLAALSRASAVIVDPCDLPSAEQLSEVRSSVFRTEFKASLDHLLRDLRPCGMASMGDIIAWNRAHPAAIPYGQTLLEAADATGGIRAPAYLADRRRDLVLGLDAGIRAALKAGGTDVLMVPLAAAAKCTGKAGAPVAAIPAGMDGDGQPFGMTVFAEPGRDRFVLGVAAAIERALGEAASARVGGPVAENTPVA